MKEYKNIVLNIPHSSKDIPYNKWEGDIEKEVEKWTDTYTDVIFKPKNTNVHFVFPVVFPYSRFYCDVERLINDPLWKQGQGIYYTNFNGCKREMTNEDYENTMKLWHSHQDMLLSQIKTDDTLLIDCHSFPSEIVSNVDICLGWNNDTSKPSDALIETVKGYFEGFGYKVALNNPYSNSITPEGSGYNYHSLMIEINKKIYLNEETGELLGSAYKLNIALNYLYKNIKDKWKF